MTKEDLIKALADAGHRESALLLKNWGEMDSVAEEFAKSDVVKPFGTSVYDEAANRKRKASRTGEEVKDAGKNVGVRQFTTSGSSVQAAHEAKQQKEQKKKTKASTKVFTQEEKEALAAKMGVKASPPKKGD